MLDGVLGALTEAQDGMARTTLLGLGSTLIAAARRVGGKVGWLNTRVELHWMLSGQQSLWTCVGTADTNENAVCFIVELGPGWYFGQRTGRVSWIIELMAETDCQHSPDQGSMHEVHSQATEAFTVEGAFASCSEAVRILDSFTSEPVENWTAMGAAIR